MNRAVTKMYFTQNRPSLTTMAILFLHNIKIIISPKRHKILSDMRYIAEGPTQSNCLKLNEISTRLQNCLGIGATKSIR
jgi:hypothetical protein